MRQRVIGSMKRHVEGKMKDKKVFLWALSTCMWCKKTRSLLEDSGVDYNYIYVDELEGEERERVLNEVQKHKPALSFRTLLIGERCIVGFDEKKIREALGIS
ncbi:MAG: glutaredoxin family protein [Thermoplasmata archaeon]